MIAGRKLLLADDSIAIQKVVDLTFTDEGMEVTTVGDGREALAKLEQSTPDVVLADVFMPGVDGYELCKFIKADERFRNVPVMLLVGTFEPFDETEAKRAGADDVVTKPFQSIRDLVSRVSSLMRRDESPKRVVDDDEPVPAIDEAHVMSAESVDYAESEKSEPPQVKVFVEAPMMETAEVDVPEHTSPPDIDLQTADTQQLAPVEARPEFDETIEVEVIDDSQESAPSWNAATFASTTHEPGEVTAAAAADDDGVLDLGDVDSFAAAQTEEDFELDLDVQPVALSGSGSSASSFETAEAAPMSAPSGTNVNPTHLSPEAIEAISQRVVEKLSDQVVREIAWEVVPELSELLIKKQLQERG